jgi:uncharacterized protein YajQ (UPF0234 family)
MPSFDIVSKADLSSVLNAIDGVQREINTRYDFKGSQSKVEFKENIITIIADDELKRKQVEELIITHVTRKKVDAKFLSFGKIEVGSSNTIRQNVEILSGIQRENAQKIIKEIKQMKNKVQIQIQGDELRASVKKRDDLQSTITFLKTKFAELPLQFINFRD